MWDLINRKDYAILDKILKNSKRENNTLQLTYINCEKSAKNILY